jgi:hypothetical protein
MEAIKRIIPKKQFKRYNIPYNFGDQAEMIIIPIKEHEEESKISSFDLMKLQGESGITQMLNEPGKDFWDTLTCSGIE